ncbi:MAG TPA: ABC transporter substrate-binding protein [Candidatus Scatomorpha intestinavium]|uniref:ABC transporter substrate-binding protein n=1 Tax=Candidatus Scatomorpha intestinavium TaxID=2840922 RepID=A0A9D1CTH4_9FIRM|nr:ABC transporter substrate-binding protein [Candidatus Scatomorpha intestinavium]
MKNIKKFLALALALAMVFALAACGEEPATESPAAESEAPVESEAPNDTLVFATATFGQKFSPFFATTAYDQDVVNLTQGALLAADREGNIVRNGIEGETIEYNGTEYTYYGMGDVEVVMNDDGTVDYNLTMRDDIVFSDGTPADIDDVIFGLYVMLDPTYDGASTLYAMPIEGLQEYMGDMTPLYELMLAAGRDNTDFTNWDEETQTAFWDSVDNEAGPAFAQTIVDYVIANYGTTGVADSAAMWDYEGLAEDATAADFWNAIVEKYGGDVATAVATEVAETPFSDLLDNEYKVGVASSDSAPNVSGIVRTGDYSMTIHMTSYDATAIYKMSLYIAPLHYYGDESLYDYENNSFGFPKGDLSVVREKTTQPMGCGPYVFEGYSNGVVTLSANEYYYLGKPATQNLLMQESVDSDYVPGIITGSYDLALPSISDDTITAIESANSNGELTGDVLTTNLVDYRGYGYIGINANLVNVGGDPGSDASKNLRKALMTVMSVYRDTVINSYYGEQASVIQYPISNTSWAAPRPTDEGYQNAYSVDVNGEAIYTDGMTEQERFDAALQAAIGYLQAAGYTWDEATGTFTAAPEGASMTYEFMIPGQGEQDHPAYGVGVSASEALATIGITLQVNDVGTAVWNTALEANTCEIWAAAWQATADPDMYQVYHSSNANGAGTNSNHYQIQDAELDQLIMDGRGSADNDFRAATYKTAMDIIMDWGVELPLYQRKDAIVSSTERVVTDSLPQDMTPYWVWYAEIETLAVQ